MSAYVIVQVTVQDAAAYERYKTLAAASVAVYGGRYIVRGGRTEVLEGSWRPARLVILEFPDPARAREWWGSVEYTAAKEIRQACAGTEMLLAEGL
ncbi:MAG: DUF1330 domain-containing protein [Gemmatimonadales bacterium]|nr:DUF1330 domain-containing protein [Gemmatimonadales bacterium]